MEHPLTVDLEFGLKQLSGNKTLLLRMLNKFKDEYTHVMDKLEAHLNDGEIVEAHRVIHTIKGVAGNLGLSALHQVSREYEAFLKSNQPDMDTAKREFNQILQATLADIDKIEPDEEIKPTTAAASPAPSAMGSMGGKEELMASLKRNEFISPGKLDLMLQQLNLDPSTTLVLKQHINDLEYPEAISMLEGS